MIGRHATPAEFERYVLGALEPDRIEAFEAHCAACPSCAEALCGEARLEVAFEQVARRSARVAPTAGFRAVAYGAAGLAAMAAAMLLWLGHAPAHAATSEAAAAVSHALDDGAILDARNDALDGG